jgi:hypothetical protein
MASALALPAAREKRGRLWSPGHLLFPGQGRWRQDATPTLRPLCCAFPWPWTYRWTGGGQVLKPCAAEVFVLACTSAAVPAAGRFGSPYPIGLLLVQPQTAADATWDRARRRTTHPLRGIQPQGTTPPGLEHKESGQSSIVEGYVQGGHAEIGGSADTAVQWAARRPPFEPSDGLLARRCAVTEALGEITSNEPHETTGRQRVHRDSATN